MKKFLLRLAFIAITLVALLQPYRVVYAEEASYSVATADYQLTLRAKQTPQLNHIYQWQAQLTALSNQADLTAIKASQVRISGGMPAHGHGLPTQPIAMNLTQNNRQQILFDIQGLKFQMWGDWTVSVQIPDMSEPLVVAFELQP